MIIFIFPKINGKEVSLKYDTKRHKYVVRIDYKETSLELTKKQGEKLLEFLKLLGFEIKKSYEALRYFEDNFD